MTTEAVPEVPDRRRAVALLSHKANTDTAGAKFIIEQAREDARIPHLLAAVIENGLVVFGALRTTPESIKQVQSQFEDWAGQNDKPDYRRAASAGIARQHGRHDLVQQMVDEATADGRLAELVGTAAQMFIDVMPELTTPEGRKQLGQMSATIAGWTEDGASTHGAADD